MSPPSKTDKKRKTRKKAKRNKNHNVVTSAGSSVLDEPSNNGRSTAEKDVSAASGFGSRTRRKNLSGTTVILPRKQLKGSSNTATRNQTGKENSYSVWQKVQRNDLLPVNGSDIDKGSSVCLELGLTCKDEASIKRKVSKEKACKKSKRKSQRICNCYANEYVHNTAEDKETSVSDSTKVDQTSKEGESAELSKGSGCVQQKWIPIGIIKEPEFSNSVGLKKLNWDLEIPDPDPDPDPETIASDFLEEDCISLQAVQNTVKVQLASEAIEFATGCPIAEFERLLKSSSPSVSLDISLQSLWQWYEKHGIYGLEVRAEDHKKNSTRLGIDQLSFRAYFVPFLSAIQLFGATEERKRETQNNAWTDDGELLFEYFEYERPQLRQPLYEKIHELARGDGLSGSKMFGNPSTLVSTSIPELHKKSWYSVAWYPIYKIPDGSLRAAFLTYHSFGHLVERKVELGSPTMVCPVVGLQSYNAQDECWFQPRHSAADHQTEEGELGSSQVLKERLRTLKETACCMARATVKKGEEKSAKNWHPDYEFFLSRQLY
ncbi:hypothetical protein LINGRAHAP2_LOCUS16969 [Linum grandiflorum]